MHLGSLFLPVKARPLTADERHVFLPYFPRVVIERARIIDGAVPFWLHKGMCAVVLGCHIYLRAGIYQMGTVRGVELLGHELTHVSQFLHGMTILGYLWSCRHGYRQSSYEQQAYTQGALIARDFAERGLHPR